MSIYMNVRKHVPVLKYVNLYMLMYIYNYILNTNIYVTFLMLKVPSRL
jgi:hypothetical protein